MNLLSHTPPAFGVGSLETPIMKRARSGSISNRLRSASELCEEGMIDKDTKGVLKDLIIRDDPKLQHAMKRIEEGDKEVLRDLIADGTLNRKSSIDLMGEYGDLNFDFLNVGQVGSPGDSLHNGGDFMDTDQFEFSFNDEGGSASSSSNAKPIHSSGIPRHGRINTRNSSLSSKRNSSLRMGMLNTGCIKEEDENEEDGGDVSGRRRNASSSLRGGPIKSEKLDVDSSLSAKPIPIKVGGTRSKTSSFSNQIPDLFDFTLFDDQLGPSNVTGSPLAHSPPRSYGSQRLHRDSISMMDEFLLGGNSGGRSGGGGGSSSYNSQKMMLSGGHSVGMSQFAYDGSVDQIENNNNFSGGRDSSLSKSSIDALNSSSSHLKVKKENIKTSKTKKKNGNSNNDSKHQKSKTDTSSKSQKQKQQRQKENNNNITESGVLSSPPLATTHPSTAALPMTQMYSADLSNNNQFIGGYSPESRRRRIEKFLQKRHNRVWMKRVKYDVRKNFADSRLRVKGRFVKKEDEELLREFLIMTM